MSARALFAAGDLAGCRAQLQSDVRQQPADGKLRVFLAQLLMVSGEWERALTQLRVAAELDASALPMLHAYSAAIQCERLRTQVFAGVRSPLILGEPPPWIASLLQALAVGGEQASLLRADALSHAQATPGRLNGSSFEWVADADSRLGPVLEVFLNGAYYWAPFERVQRVVIEAPSDIRDLVWVPVQLTWVNGGEAMGLIPSRYPGSELDGDDSIRMGRRTVWNPLGESQYSGLGQRVLASDTDEVGLLDVRELTLHAAAS
jgi:type VI secretion system protein ImpE